FAYDLLQAVAPIDELALQQGLAQLVDTELVYQLGLPPHSRDIFKHALIQDAAYQSLLKSTRQQYHQRTPQVLAAQTRGTAATPRELVAHHYTEAGLNEPAVGYWQRAGRRALERSAHAEAINHLTRGLMLLKSLAITPEQRQSELDFLTTLGPALVAIRGQAA